MAEVETSPVRERLGRVAIADTTIRDEHLLGADPRLLADQELADIWRSSPLDVAGRLVIAKELAGLGVDVIEAGFAATAAGAETIRAVAAEMAEEGPVVSGLVSAFAGREQLREAAEAVSAANRSRIHAIVDPSDLVDDLGAFRRRPADLLDETTAAIEQLRAGVDEVEFSPPQASIEAVGLVAAWTRAAIEAGATTINLRCVLDSPEPEPSLALISELRRLVPLGGVTLSADLFARELRGGEAFVVATGCAEAALEAGCRQVKCAFHGVAATPGHPSLEMLAFQAWLRNRLRESHLWTDVDTTRLLRASGVIANAKGIQLPPSQPLVGEDTTSPHPSDFPEDPFERALTATSIRIVLEGLGLEVPQWLDEFSDPTNP